MKRQTALVTGAARGIGRDVTAALSARGWQVVAGVRDVDACTIDDPNVTVVHLDVTDAESIRAAVGRAEAIAGGALDAVISNAGHAMLAPFEDLDIQLVREMFEVNTFGAVAVVQAALGAMRRARAGRIVFVSTVGVHLYTPYFSAYRASKAALNAFAGTLAVEVRQFGIRVSTVEPGMVATEFSRSTRRASSLTDPDSPYAEMSAVFMGGLRKWRDWVSIPAGEVSDQVLALLDDPDPAPSVLVGEDAVYLATLDESGMREFLGFDDR